MKREIYVYDTPSEDGGKLTVSIAESFGRRVSVRAWHGQATSRGWKSWGGWDGLRLIVSRDQLENPRKLIVEL
jgi:hypothetical protein